MNGLTTSRFPFDPDTYLALMATEIRDYERFQSEVAAAELDAG